MTEKKRPSVAEILAAARKDGAGGSSKPAETSAPEPAQTNESPPAEVAETPANETPRATTAAAKPAKPAAAGGRPSVADILAAARANKSAAPTAAPKSAAEKPKPAAKSAADKPAAKPAAAQAPAAEGITNTASILAAARGQKKPGPITKAEAAALANPAAPAKEVAAAKARLAAPPPPAKPDYAKKKEPKPAATEPRRSFFVQLFVIFFGSSLAVGFTSMTLTFVAWLLGSARFMFPNILTEPPSSFKVGPPSDFPPGAVSEKFKAQFGVWVVNGEYNGQRQIYALRTVCTHLGCTPNWLEAEQKFKCPCHGSGFYKDGINFEGPAPRPLERYAIRLADDGQLEVNKSRTFQEEMGNWTDPACFVAV